MAHYDYGQELLEFWRDLSQEYRDLIPTYERLLAKKRELGLRLDVLTKTTLRGLPEIDFLRCETLNEAQSYIDNIEKTHENPCVYFFKLRLQLDCLRDNYSFRAIKDRNKMYQRQIKNRHVPRTYVRRIPNNKPTK